MAEATRAGKSGTQTMMDRPFLGDVMPIGQIRRRAFIAALGGAATVALQCIASATAQVYPSHPVTMIVPFPAGGPSDKLARILAERMRISLGQPVVIENVSGAGASIGVARLARAVPDGYTIGIGNMTSHVGAPAIYPIAYNVLTDLEPVSLLTFAPLWIVGKISTKSFSCMESKASSVTTESETSERGSPDSQRAR